MRCDDGVDIPEGSKKIHFIRHGQGHHNIAQAEWRAAGKAGEPYVLSTDPDMKFGDAELTEVGRQQAVDLRVRSALLDPEVMVTSPMRRAMLTGLLAFEDHVAGAREGDPMPVVAYEAAHEIAGKHTCDKRLAKAQLAELFPMVDFSLVEAEEDPFWGDGTMREDHAHLAARAAELVDIIRARPERHIVVAAHSTILLTLLNAVLVITGDTAEADTSWFSTGEMRTYLLRWEAQCE